MVPLSDTQKDQNESHRPGQASQHPTMEPNGTTQKKIVVVGLATESSRRHTSKIERQQDLSFCFAPGGKEDHFYGVCKHTRSVIVADA